jgi:hypothetical protein
MILPPPLPSMLAVLMVLGTVHLSSRGARWLRGSAASPIEFAAAFVLTTGLLTALVHALARARHVSISAMRLGRMRARGTGCFGSQLVEARGEKRVLRTHFVGSRSHPKARVTS